MRNRNPIKKENTIPQIKEETISCFNIKTNFKKSLDNYIKYYIVLTTTPDTNYEVYF